MKIFQSKINGELFIAYPVYKYDNGLTYRAIKDNYFIETVGYTEIGILVEQRGGYAGIFKSLDLLYRQAEYIGEL